MAQQVQSVVSAEADARMAQDAMVMATREWKAVQQQMMEQVTDANWWSWQERVKAAKAKADRAAMAFMEASKVACRVSREAWEAEQKAAA